MKKILSIIFLVATFMVITLCLASCSKNDDSKTSEITYSLSKFTCTDGGSNEHKLAADLKQQLENGCVTCKGKDTGSAKKYFNDIISGFAKPENAPFSYDISISYTADTPGVFNWKETLK